MLQLMRKGAATWVAKSLFIILILSFGIWGIGDIFRNRGESVSIARVGDDQLEPQQLRQMVDRAVQNFQQAYKGQSEMVDSPQMRTAIAQQNIEQWISEKLYLKEASHLGLAVSDDFLKRRIAEDPSFQDEKTKQFSPEKFRAILQANNWTESQLLVLLRKEIINSQLAQALGGGINSPKIAQKALFEYDNQTRDAIVMDIPYSKYPAFAKLVGGENFGSPTTKQLEEFVAANPQPYSTAEYRKLTVLTLSPEKVASTISISDDEAKQAFESRKAEFETPEKRRLSQAVFKTEAEANAAYQLVSKDKKSLADAAQKAGASHETDMGDLTKTDLPSELSDPVFAAKEGEYTKPAQSKLGWHIVAVKKILPGHSKTFADVKSELKNKLAIEKSSEKIYKLSDQLQDELAGGAALSEIAKKLPVDIATIGPVDKTGYDVNGKKNDISSAKRYSQLLTVAFSTAEGKNSGLTQGDEGGYYVIHVDNVTPAKLKPLSEIKDQVVKAWQEQDKAVSGRIIQEKLAAELKSGKKLADLAKQYGLSTREITNLERSNNVDSKSLFAVAKGEPATMPTKDGVAVGIVTAVHRTNKSMEGQVGIVTQTKKEFAQDISDQLQNALRDRFDVMINQQALQTLY